MSQRNVSGWLPNLIGPIDIQQAGTSITPLRQTWNFASGVTVTDVYVDEETSYTNFAFTGGAMATIGPVIANASTGGINNLSSLSGADIGSAIRFSGAAPSVTGITNGTGGRELWVVATGGPLTLVNESGSSTAANRIITGTGADITIADESAALLWYDATSSRWRVFKSGDGSTVAAGNGVRVVQSGSTYTVHGVRGSCCPETFLAVGDGSTDDTTALQDMIDALEAGTYTHAELGAKTYKITTGLVFNASAKLAITGQGPASRIYATNAVTAAALLIRNATDIHLSDFEIYGDATFNTAGVNTAAGGGTGQNGIEIGYLGGDGTSRVRILNVSCHNLGGRGLSFAYGPDIRGPVISNFSAYETLVGIYALDASAITDFKAWKCGTGLHNAGGGNVFVVGGDIVNCATGMRLGAGSNDTHGSAVGLTIRHSGTNAVRTEAINNGYLFVGCTFYEGNLLFDGGNAGEVVFSACILDCTLYTLAGNALWIGCRFDQAYILTPATDFVTTGGRNIFRDCKDINGTVPSFIGATIQNQWAFASDANDTLTAQESVAATLVVTSGTITASRQITSNLAPNVSNRQRIVNDNAEDVTFKWSSGTAVTIPAGYSALVGADSTGTNAKIIDPKEVGGGGGGSPGGSSGDIQYNNGGSFGGLAGTNGQLMRYASGAWGGGNDVTYVALGGGTPYSTTAHVRLPYAATDTIIGVKDSGGTDRVLFSRTSADTYQMGAGGTTFAMWFDWYVLNLWGRSAATCYAGSGGTTTWVADGTNFKVGIPVCGLAAESKPFQWKRVSVDLSGATGGSTTTLSAAQYECPFIDFTGSGAAGTINIVAPNTSGAFFILYNGAGGSAPQLNFKISGGTGFTLATSRGCLTINNSSDYIRLTADSVST